MLFSTLNEIHELCPVLTLETIEDWRIMGLLVRGTSFGLLSQGGTANFWV